MRTRILAPQGVFAAALALFVVRLGAMALWDNDETIYTQIAREMIQSGDWITMHWRGSPWFNHPPLHFWLVALLSFPLGMTEVAARLPAAIFGAGCVALVAMWGRALFTPRAGVLAAAALALNFQFFVESRMANMDTAILFFVTLSLFGFWRGYQGERSGWYLMFAASGLACLAKGPFGLVFPWMVILPFLALTRQLARLRAIPWLSGGLLAIAIGLSWHAVEWMRHGPAFGESVFVTYTWNRLTSKVMNQGGPIWTYVPILLAGFFPWSLFLPQALAGLWKRRASAPAALLIAIWVIVPFLFFSLVVTKLPNYILFVYPGAALAVGWFLDRALLEHPARLRPAVAIGAGVTLGAALAVRVWAAPTYREYSWQTWRVAEMLLAIVAAAAVVAVVLLYRRNVTAIATLAIGMAAFLVGCGVFLAPEIERYRPMKPLGQAVNQIRRPGDELVIYRLAGGHGLEFYTGGRVGVIEAEEDLRMRLRTTPGLLMVMPQDVYERLSADEAITAIASAANAVLAVSRQR